MATIKCSKGNIFYLKNFKGYILFHTFNNMVGQLTYILKLLDKEKFNQLC